ncbi:MAG: hypothetical protein VKJ64_14835 [Leptolyngbyaceae bacterium]|nr:hypothetical protein [Leptolyngbyaceae bacterium]
MARQPHSAGTRQTGSHPDPVAPLFSPASQQHGSAISAEPPSSAIAHNGASREQGTHFGATSDDSPHRSAKSPILPRLPKPPGTSVATNALAQANLPPMAAVTPATIVPLDSQPNLHQQENPYDQQGTIAELRQTLDVSLETPIFEASILEQLENGGDTLPDHTSQDRVSLTGVSQPAMVPEALRRRRRQRQKRSPFTGLAWPLLWVFMFMGLAGVGSFAFLWMASLPPSLDCKDLSPLSADAKRLHCANLAAASGNLEDILKGFELVRPWSSNHPLFFKAQDAMVTWTEEILKVAEANLYAQGLTEALALLETVPSTSPLYDRVVAKQQEWQGLWDRGDEIEQTALAAVQAGQWDVAAQQVVEMGKLNHPYWRQERSNTLSLRVVAERQGQDAYQKAQEIAIARTPEALAAALTELQQIQPQTFAWEQAQADLAQWSEAIAQASQQRFQAGDIEGMLTLVKALPTTPELLPQIDDLMKIGYAQRQAKDDPDNWTPGLLPVAKWITALTTAAQVDADSPFYAYTQTQMVDWQRQLQDLAQLQLAQAIAATGHRTALKLAIEQASLVAKGQPRRIQAQTLIADWRQAIERVEDRADLALAYEMAAPGTLAALARAIAQAKTIQPNRILHSDADAAISQWVTQMQMIEDQPILDRAAELAAAGDWAGAIAEADTIGSDRALYATARSQIGDWQAAIAVAQHRSILAEARTLADQVRLTAAINLANSIPASSASVYQEAQDAIAEWSRERDRIWAEQNQPVTPTPSPSPSPTVSASPVPSPVPSPAPAPSPQPSGNFEGYYDSRYYDYYGN